MSRWTRCRLQRPWPAAGCPRAKEARVRHSRIRAVVTDVHFWIPVVVLVLGATLLLVLP
jgi:hypothetical protein